MPIAERPLDQQQADETVRRELARRTRRSFLLGGAAAVAGVAAYDWLWHAPSRNLLQSPLRDAFTFDRTISNGIFRQRIQTPTYPTSAATGLRINGLDGVERALDLSSWGLALVGLQDPERYPKFQSDVNAWPYRFGTQSGPQIHEGPDVKRGRSNSAATTSADMRGPQHSALQSASVPAVPGVVLGLSDLQRLPYTEQITQFRCIEGWSQIVRWGGVRFSDFLRAYPPADINGVTPRFVTLATPDGIFDASFDMPAMLHPQTLLCYSMGGRPLEPLHGAPLRLAMPLKYGYKQIKQIGRITYTNTRAVDFWEKLGFDWYAGL